MVRTIIKSTGVYLPEKVVTNHDLEKTIETSDEWIVARTGIKERHIAAESELTSDMAVAASKQALARADLRPNDIDIIIVATTTPDQIFPSTGTIVQQKLGLHKGAAFDIQAVCSGFVYGLSTADAYIRSGMAKRILLIGAEKMSAIVDWQDRGTCILFGDGAGAVVLEATDDESRGVLSSDIRSDGAYNDILYVDGGPAQHKHGSVHMEGREVFKHAVSKMAAIVEEGLKRNGLTTKDMDLLIPHQANVRILQSVAKKLRLRDDQVMVTVQGHANTSAASIPLALDQALQEDRIKEGDIVSLVALGGGLTWGDCVIRW